MNRQLGITNEQKKAVIREINRYFLKNRLMESEGDEQQGQDDNDSGGEARRRRFVISKNTPQFGDVRTSQEDMLLKTIGEPVELEDDALVYYPGDGVGTDDVTLDGTISSMDLNFQFRYNKDNGCYIWCKEMQLTPSNYQKIGKIRDAFDNWRESFIKNGDLMKNLNRAANRDESYGNMD